MATHFCEVAEDLGRGGISYFHCPCTFAPRASSTGVYAPCGRVPTLSLYIGRIAISRGYRGLFRKYRYLLYRMLASLSRCLGVYTCFVQGIAQANTFPIVSYRES